MLLLFCVRSFIIVKCSVNAEECYVHAEECYVRASTVLQVVLYLSLT